MGRLGAAFEALRKKARRDDATIETRESEESIVEEFLHSKLEKHNLANWSNYEEKAQGSPISLALCRLAKKLLTSPLTATNSEGLSSVLAG